MSSTNHRALEALYIVFLREKNAEQMLRDWAKEHKVQAAIESNRMKLFDRRGLDLLMLYWAHDWDNVTIWDTWHKRHIYIQ